MLQWKINTRENFRKYTNAPNATNHKKSTNLSTLQER